MNILNFLLIDAIYLDYEKFFFRNFINSEIAEIKKKETWDFITPRESIPATIISVTLSTLKNSSVLQINNKVIEKYVFQLIIF